MGSSIRFRMLRLCRNRRIFWMMMDLGLERKNNQQRTFSMWNRNQYTLRSQWYQVYPHSSQNNCPSPQNPNKNNPWTPTWTPNTPLIKNPRKANHHHQTATNNTSNNTLVVSLHNQVQEYHQIQYKRMKNKS